MGIFRHHGCFGTGTLRHWDISAQGYFGTWTFWHMYILAPCKAKQTFQHRHFGMGAPVLKRPQSQKMSICRNVPLMKYPFQNISCQNVSYRNKLTSDWHPLFQIPNSSPDKLLYITQSLQGPPCLTGAQAAKRCPIG